MRTVEVVGVLVVVVRVAAADELTVGDTARLLLMALVGGTPRAEVLLAVILLLLLLWLLLKPKHVLGERGMRVAALPSLPTFMLAGTIPRAV